MDFSFTRNRPFCRNLFPRVVGPGGGGLEKKAPWCSVHPQRGRHTHQGDGGCPRWKAWCAGLGRGYHRLTSYLQGRCALVRPTCFTPPPPGGRHLLSSSFLPQHSIGDQMARKNIRGGLPRRGTCRCNLRNPDLEVHRPTPRALWDVCAL